jgi:hypothetical protein
MNYPYEIDMNMYIDRSRKRKYSEIESVLRKKVPNKKPKCFNSKFYNVLRKYAYEVQQKFF